MQMQTLLLRVIKLKSITFGERHMNSSCLLAGLPTSVKR